MENLINKFKRARTINQIQKKYNGKYAFVGIGNHSINNLYPVLDYLHADLKYIVTKSEETANAIKSNYKGVQGTNNFDAVLNDTEISGVLISAHPKAHFELVKQALLKNKNVFIEKPPCYTKAELQELIDIEEKSKAFVLVGLQKRYAPLYIKLGKFAKKTNYYNYRYIVGSYPEGDNLVELFIHPLDIVSHLFGAAKIISLQKVGKTQSNQTLLIHLAHENGAIGNLELSSDFWWAKSHESMYVNTSNEYLESKNMDELVSMPKPKTFLSVPVEKIVTPTFQKTILYEQNSFLPAKEQNQLYSSGYYNEIKCFLDLCEGRKSANHSALKSLLNTYHLIDEIKKNR
jgi:virulence factor